MAAIKAVTAKGQLVPLNFYQADVAASQTDVQLSVCAVDNAADDQLATTEYLMPWPGEIVGISYVLSAAGTAGVFTIGATFSGTEDADTRVTVGTNASNYARVGRGAAKFAAGAAIGCEITTDGSWDGTGADLVATVWALVYLEGI
jgi:hypothetical protein